MPLNRRNNKVKGEWAEIAFLLEAHRRGFIVSRPWRESAPYDFIIESKLGLFRVQVKSAWAKDDKGYAFKTCGSRHRYYRPGEIDVIVGFVPPENAWYVIPFRALGRRRTVYIYPHKPNSKANLEKFRNNWRLFSQTDRKNRT